MFYFRKIPLSGSDWYQTRLLTRTGWLWIGLNYMAHMLLFFATICARIMEMLATENSFESAYILVDIHHTIPHHFSTPPATNTKQCISNINSMFVGLQSEKIRPLRYSSLCYNSIPSIFANIQIKFSLEKHKHACIINEISLCRTILHWDDVFPFRKIYSNPTSLVHYFCKTECVIVHECYMTILELRLGQMMT